MERKNPSLEPDGRRSPLPVRYAACDLNELAGVPIPHPHRRPRRHRGLQGAEVQIITTRMPIPLIGSLERSGNIYREHEPDDCLNTCPIDR